MKSSLILIDGGAATKKHERGVMMEINQIINPSTTLGALIIGFIASFLAGFLTGRSIEKKKYVAKSKVKGDSNVVIQNSNNK